MTQKTIFSLIVAAAALTFSSCVNNNNNSNNPNALNTTGISGGYPVAKPMVDPKTGQAVKDHYVSPFRPYNPIVAKGFKSGQLAGDPSTIKVDPKTGKPNKATMKVFKLP